MLGFLRAYAWLGFIINTFGFNTQTYETTDVIDLRLLNVQINVIVLGRFGIQCILISVIVQLGIYLSDYA